MTHDSNCRCAQNKLLREALAVCEKGKQRYASLYESTTDELQTAREEIKNAQKQARVFEDMCQRYGLREEQVRSGEELFSQHHCTAPHYIF